MNKQFIWHVAATVLLTTATQFFEQAHAEVLDISDTSSHAEVLDISDTSSQEAIEVSTNNQSLEPSLTDTSQALLRSTATVRVNAHQHENRQAATVYIKNIPVLTYIDSGESTDVVSGWLQTTDAKADDGVLADAATLSAQLEQLYGQNITFTAHWQEGNYVVMAGDSPLVTLGDTVQLPDATDNEAEDVLQVTNRLRRLLGNEAEPVSEVIGRPAPPPPAQQIAAVRSSYNGMASWYGPGFHGRTSASGESFNQHAMTAAHRTLPFGTQVRVTNLNNGQQVVVRINDRGPYSHGRIIDLSAGAARAIGLQSAGVGPVQVEVLQ
ncbi:septal ring lytic transglycosylase RlpA family protein [Leptothoe sp. PORK10 BA2]|uniref:septal ring lytic transglycosylase RlpA family protein n=1 Tax=Leptothoe sp. PORK10 BA2 TaxID=3110254 RepID=UPI002B20F87B|nr:septal ring lytic transglycosylase RlpA family protein [Leptothoe sp. PORK10 BA2]MEA5462643.1 septal ring lytic transglycosylase RlpA family protein [Leptothoe sp. PORK10 BA2]